MDFPNRYRVLYAEDNEDSRLMVTVMCEFIGIEVVTTSTVAEAWRAAQTELFDLYLLEPRFPGQDGLEFCRRLREYAPKTPIVIYSTAAYETDRNKGLAAGANDYLTKPYDGDLAAALKRKIELTKNIDAANINDRFSFVSNKKMRRPLAH